MTWRHHLVLCCQRTSEKLCIAYWVIDFFWYTPHGHPPGHLWGHHVSAPPGTWFQNRVNGATKLCIVQDWDHQMKKNTMRQQSQARIWRKKQQSWTESKTRRVQSLRWRSLSGICKRTSVLDSHKWSFFTVNLCLSWRTSSFLRKVLILPCLETTLPFFVCACITLIRPDFFRRGFHLGNNSIWYQLLTCWLLFWRSHKFYFLDKIKDIHFCESILAVDKKLRLGMVESPWSSSGSWYYYCHHSKLKLFTHLLMNLGS